MPRLRTGTCMHRPSFLESPEESPEGLEGPETAGPLDNEARPEKAELTDEDLEKLSGVVKGG